MEEIFKNFEPPFDGYKISNMGRVLNPKGKEQKIEIVTQIKNGVTYKYPYVNINIRKKNSPARKRTLLAHEVYRLFGDGFKDRAKVYYKDGNAMNCRIDNLFISSGYLVKPTDEQIEIYINDAKACILHFVRENKLREYRGLDIDNIIGEAYLLIWKHLSQYKTDTSFYAFCKRYTRWAFLYEYKKLKQLQEHCVSYEWLVEQKRPEGGETEQ